MYAPARGRHLSRPDVADDGHQLAGAPGAGGAGVPDRGESNLAASGRWAAPAAHRRRPAQTSRTGPLARPSDVARACDDRHAGHVARWHRQLIARKWTYAKQGQTRRRVVAEIRQLVRRMAEENPRWGYTRIQGALKNLGHRVGRSTIARILRTDGIPPVPERPTSWQTFLRAHLGGIAAADFFTTEVWTWRGLVTFYTVDRDTKWSEAARARLHDAGIRVVQTPYRAQNANAFAERFVRSIKEECLNRLIPLGERHHRRAVAELSSTIIASGIIRDRTTTCLTASLRKGVSVECVDTNVSVGCSITTPEQRKRFASGLP